MGRSVIMTHSWGESEMELLNQGTLNLSGKSLSEDIEFQPPVQAIKVLVSGELKAGRTDRRLLLRVNGVAEPYVSFVLMNGHATMGEWDKSGLYVGRIGWGLDADVSAEVTVSSLSIKKRIISHGLSTFAHSDGRTLGYQNNGYVVKDGPISSLTILITGGTFKGELRVFRMA